MILLCVVRAAPTTKVRATTQPSLELGTGKEAALPRYGEQMAVKACTTPCLGRRQSEGPAAPSSAVLLCLDRLAPILGLCDLPRPRQHALWDAYCVPIPPEPRASSHVNSLIRSRSIVVACEIIKQLLAPNNKGVRRSMQDFQERLAERVSRITFLSTLPKATRDEHLLRHRTTTKMYAQCVKEK